MSPAVEGWAALAELGRRGGPVLWLITAVALVVYGQLAYGLLELAGAAGRGAAMRCQRRLISIRAGIAAAPLLGLLGTVGGLVTSFEGLMADGRPTALADGIGQAMLTTEYGLLVAAPALALCGLLERRARRVAVSGAAPGATP